MGVHQLIGHWRECQLKGVDYDKCPEDQLVDSIERAYFVAKPDDMDSDEFKKLMLQLMTIEGHTQDSIVYHDGELVYIQEKYLKYQRIYLAILNLLSYSLLLFLSKLL